MLHFFMSVYPLQFPVSIQKRHKMTRIWFYLVKPTKAKDEIQEVSFLWAEIEDLFSFLPFLIFK